MFYKIFNQYTIMTFPPEEFDNIIKNIKKSYAYLGYIDVSQEKGIENKRFAKYLNIKQSYYTRQVPHKEKSLQGFSYSVFDPNISKYPPKDVQFAFKQEVKDDYYYHKELYSEDGQTFAINHMINPVERHIHNLALDTEEYIQKTDLSYLKKDKILNQARFTLFPFIAKIDGEFVEPTILVTVYRDGILTINIMISFTESSVGKVGTEPPSIINFDYAEFYPKQKEYKSKDYWKKERKDSVTIKDVTVYYEDLIKHICSANFFSNPEFKQTSWVLGDFNPHKNLEHSQFISLNKSYYFSLLKNSPADYVKHFSTKDMDQSLEKALTASHKHMHFYANGHTGILSINHMLFSPIAVNYLKDKEKALKKEKLYEEELNNLYKELTWKYMFEYLRFYELTFIKKFFLRKVLEDLNSNSYNTLSDYNKVKQDMSLIRLKYNEESLFQADGSPKELYKNLLDKTNTNSLLEKVENLFIDLKDDIDKQRDFQIKRNESFIYVVTSLLTVLLSYRGLKFIVNDILINIPFIGPYVEMHPLRYTVALWGLIIIGMLYLNYQRQKSFNK
ncbi:hypothetical protein [Rossellomorea arthrocnemi]|uniref:hypothetical protein n=1 Tax=Rossellomorea arthrocnemi TaxID=2769542 RepID=UPI00191B01B4|nr:hypothetical protein [Rossellomorea arthrocnemi]